MPISSIASSCLAVFCSIVDTLIYATFILSSSFLSFFHYLFIPMFPIYMNLNWLW
nr:MAG TPA: hypothetical protein [Caudoviricetes sp.]